MIVTLDPGKNGCGLAWGHNDKLVGARYVPNPEKTSDPYGNCVAMAKALHKAMVEAVGFSQCTRVVLEHPRVYFGKGRNDANDLFCLAGVGAAFAAYLADYCDPQTVSVFPAQWKGQVPKAVMTKRIQSRLSPDEEAKVQKFSKTYDHNTYDAVGILLWDMGRL